MENCIGIFRNEEEERSHVCKFLKDDLAVDPELLKGTDRMKAQGFGASASASRKKYDCIVPCCFKQLLSNLLGSEM